MPDRLTQEQMDDIETSTAYTDADTEIFKLITELRLLQRDLKDARKENGVLMDWVVKHSEASRKLLDTPMPSDDKDPNYNRLIDRRIVLRDVLNEVPK